MHWKMAFYASVRMRRRYTVVGLCVCVCVYQSASWISKIATNSELVSAIQLEGDVLSNLISLEFLFKALLSSYGVICSP